MTVCPKCKGYGIVGSAVPDILRGRGAIFSSNECDMCHGTGEVPMTNEEYLKSCTTEQLAEWLGNTFDLCGAGCSKCFIKELCFDEHNNKMPTELFVEWLKQPHQLTTK